MLPAAPTERGFTIICNACGSTECYIKEDGFFTMSDEWEPMGWIVRCKQCGNEE